MSFKSILAPIDSTHAAPATFQAALRLARRFGAKLELLSYAPPPPPSHPLLGATIGSAQAVADALDALRASAEEALEAAQREAQGMGLAHEGRLACSPLIALQEAVAQHGLLCDLIVTQRLEEGVRSRREIIQGALFYSAAPLLVWPPDLAGETAEHIGGSVLVAWDGRKPASVAARLALPLLRAANAVTVVCGEEEFSELSFETEPGVGFLEWLRGQGVTAELQALEGSDVSGALHEAADERKADLIVMGGYGHSQMLESIFGGVTESMLQETSIPLFMAH